MRVGKLPAGPAFSAAHCVSYVRHPQPKAYSRAADLFLSTALRCARRSCCFSRLSACRPRSITGKADMSLFIRCQSKQAVQHCYCIVTSLLKQAVQHYYCIGRNPRRDRTYQPPSTGHKSLHTTAARDDLEPRSIGETVSSVSIAWHCRLRMQTEYRMSEYSLAE